MAINYAKIFNRRATPQSQPIPGSSQVPNSGGGYSWQVDDWTRLDRFLILGAEGGTYYIGERDLVKQNHDAIVRCIQADGVRAVNRIVEISASGRAPKNDPAIFALALVTTHGNTEAKAGLFYGGGSEQFIDQLVGVLAAGVYVLVVASIAWLVLKATIGIRVSAEEEHEGLDIGEHGNRAYYGFVSSD